MYSAYGLQKNDSMSRYELKENKDGQTSFLECDDCGNLYVKQEMAACDRCGVSLRGKTAYIHAEKQYCANCEMKRRFAIRRNNKKNQTKAEKK